MIGLTEKELYNKLKNYMYELLEENDMEEESINIVARGLSPEEAIGVTKRKDYPLLRGKEIMLSAEFDGAKGQAFTSAPCEYKGTIKELLEADILENEYTRSLFIAALNAVSMRLDKADKTIHCRNEGPEECGKNIREYLKGNYNVEKIAIVGYQPAIIANLAEDYKLRILDLDSSNIGQVKYGCKIEDGVKSYEDVVEWADLILCTGSTICNGSIVDYLDIGKEVLFFGTTIAGGAACLGAKRLCFTQE